MKLSIAILCAASASLCQDTGISGKWSGILPQGGPVLAVFHQDGNNLSGTAGPTENEQVLEFTSASIEGDHVMFAGGAFSFDLRLKGDEMRGALTNGGQSAEIVLKRVVANPDAPLPSFEAASVKRAPPPGPHYNSSMKLDRGRLTCTNVSLKKLIGRAYDLKDYQISGPDWLDSELYDIVATLPHDTTGTDAIRMVRRLLAERFHLVTHHESKDLPVFALVVGRNGPKLKEVEFGAGNTSGRPGKLTAQKIPMTNLATFLSRVVERPVLDMTGLKGFYDFDLEWTPEESNGNTDADSVVGPSLALALQTQLGLKLDARKAPVDVLVVDRADKVPTEN
jgi:uncharacterized protein (TIGR03435 family)